MLEKSGEFVIGEMAHVIGRGMGAPRADNGSGPDTYDNLILLCPTHHTIVDKAPDDFPVEKLLEWKRLHEAKVAGAMASPRFQTADQLFAYVRRQLMENRIVHSTFGPESPAALNNPLTPAVKLWDVRKVTTIIPNNQRIVVAFESNQHLVADEVWAEFLTFREHAVGFERNTYDRMDSEVVPRFPVGFALAVGMSE